MLPLIPGIALAIGGVWVLKKITGYRDEKRLEGSTKSEVMSEVNTYVKSRNSKWRLDNIEKKGNKWVAIISRPG